MGKLIMKGKFHIIILEKIPKYLKNKIGKFTLYKIPKKAKIPTVQIAINRNLEKRELISGCIE